MRLGYLAGSQIPSRTANSVHVMRMCQAYRRLGHDVTLVVPDWRHGIESGVEDVFDFYGVTERFTIRRVPRFGGGRFQAALQAALLPLTGAFPRPSLIHTRSAVMAWVSTSWLRLPTVLELHRPLSQPRQREMLRAVVSSPRLRALVVITRALSERVAPELPPGLRPVVAPDGVDGLWVKSAATREEARRRVGLAGLTGPVAVYAGHLYAGRGIELIFDLASRRPEYHFVVVGGRQAEVEPWRERARGLRNLRFLGFRPPGEVLNYLRSADVLLMPYANKIATTGGTNTAEFASPIKLFEYLAAGRPIVASTLPVLGEVLEHERNALLLPYSAESWSEALDWLRHHPEKAWQLAERASQDARSYTWEARAERILEHAMSVALPRAVLTTSGTPE